MIKTEGYPVKNPYASNLMGDEAVRRFSGVSNADPSRPAGQKPTENSASTQDTSKNADTVTLSREALEIQKLVKRDQEVKAHEAAHAAVGGQYAGSPKLSYERGPDGKLYAVSGEVSIDISAVAGQPDATLKKAAQIRAAALAPANPSAQDMRVAAKASLLAAKARTEIRMEDSLLVQGAVEGADSAGQEQNGAENGVVVVQGRASLSIVA